MTGPLSAPEPPRDFSSFAAQISPFKDGLYADFTEAEQEVYRAVHCFLIGSAEGALSLMHSVEHVIRHDIPGSFVECGVYMGANIEIMIRMLQQLGVNDRDIYLYDTFAGMPRPTASEDERLVGGEWTANYDEKKGDSGSNWMCADVDFVRQRLEPLGYPQDRLHFVKGMVEETIPAVAPPDIAILRLDTDFYPSTKHELIHLYPRLAAGGILIIDDYGAFPGCKRAVDEYQEENQTRWFLNRVDKNVRLAVKAPTTIATKLDWAKRRLKRYLLATT